MQARPNPYEVALGQAKALIRLKAVVGLKNPLCQVLLAAALLLAAPLAAKAEEARVVFAYKLPNAPGLSVTGVLVTFAPGDAGVKHHHPGSVTAYVLSGAIRSENSATGPARVYHAGESFFEPPGSVHLVSENVSKTEPASLLAIFVAPDGARLKIDDK